ncbi:MAG: type II methionyl aminopeptidase [Thermoprotei archaeon]|nr:type II methionyl aminopeptidase [Thermoprotei archaeon]
MLDDDAYDKILRAGRIASRVRKYAAEKVKPGIRVYDFCEDVERKIYDEGGKPAFPCNISINNVAAHYTPYIGDESVIPDKSVVKIDVGVHIDGYIADTAVTVSFDPKYDDLLLAVETALERAIEIIKPGIRVSKIGEVIERAIKSYGYRPIRNLSGHSIERYNLHSGVSIPNVRDMFNISKITSGHVYAIEPFGTNGVGYVVEGRNAYIYSLVKEKRVKDELGRIVLENIKKKYDGLPFAERWLRNVIPERNKLLEILKELVKSKILHAYPVLLEATGGVVAQFEHTVLVLKREVVVTTL